MEEYIVSARKYRPDNFDSVVGQDNITQTLKNSIKIKQLAQAYLFCGPRGVGKTTCARIFAKTINCSNLSPELEACNECESCDSFNNNRSLNIHELDAASNNSVEDIRNLIEKVRIPPQIGLYSVYIIDEVHMLSSSAFNAFLKTLEEPPKYVIFILATTEKHKIIPTILSRCQIFDFNRIGLEDIRKRLNFVATKEGINAKSDALHVIAQKADGAMRDALSIFDQIVSFCGKTLTYEETIKTLNVLDYDTYIKITDAFVSNDYASALKIFDNVLKNGFEGRYFISGLASHFRDLLVCKDPGTIELLEVGEDTKKAYLENSKKCSISFLFKAIDITNECDFNYKLSQNKRLSVELAILKLCNIESNKVLSQSSNAATEPNVMTEKPVASTSTATPSKTIVPEDKTKETLTEDVSTKTEVVETADLIKENEDKASVSVSKSNEKSNNEKPKSPQNILIKSISLTEIANEVNKPKEELNKEEVEEEQNTDNEHFDEEKLQGIWLEYAETLNDNPRLFTFLSKHLPVKQEENKFVVVVENNAIKEKLESFINDTHVFIKQKLNNSLFELKYTVGEVENRPKQKTKEEKLNDMISSNPELKNLVNKLSLDFE